MNSDGASRVETQPTTARGSATYGNEYLQRQLRRGCVRQAVRSLYLRHHASLVLGPTLDFGCGAGDILRWLPPGSRGLEINRNAVEYAQAKGLEVETYDPDEDRYELRRLPANQFGTLTMSHVLEHLSNPEQVMRALAASALRLGMRRMVFVVPGDRGFQSDATHVTFVDLDYLRTRQLLELAGWTFRSLHFFPINARWVGRYFTHHEMILIYDRA